MTPVKTGVHTRQHNSVLAEVEKRVLVRMAKRLPAAVNSDHLSALGLAGIAAAGLSFVALRLTPWAAVAVVASLTLNWLGDSLDGTVARVRGHQRPRYGFYVDHAIDIAGTTLLLAGIACSGAMHPVIALALLSAYLLVAAESYLATHTTGLFRISFLGFGPTELRIVLSIGAIRIASSPWVSIAGSEPIRLFDIGGAVAIVGLVIAFIANAARNTRILYKEEPLPSREHNSRVA